MSDRPQLVRRAFLASASVLAAGTVALVVTPATVSFPPRPDELAVLAAGLAVLLLLDLYLLKRSLAAPAAAAEPPPPTERARSAPPDAQIEAVLAASEDFLVDSPEGEVGLVEEVVVDENGRVTALIVRCGWFGRERCRIERGRIVEVRPHTRTIVVSEPGSTAP